MGLVAIQQPSSALFSIPIVRRPLADSFDEAGYVAANPDIVPHITAGGLTSGRDHFERFGQFEPHRRMFVTDGIAEMRAVKMERVRPLLKQNYPVAWHRGKLDCLTDEMRRAFNIPDFQSYSANPYEHRTIALIESLKDGLILDAGAGLRDTYYRNVVNLEIADTVSTDVLGVGENLPFRDASFDAVISMCVLEHVIDPFRCASEIMRVLKPGGVIHCTVPFLQPVHGFPHHYYNMTPQGLRSLFERYGASVEEQDVPRYLLPIVTLTWFVRSWAHGLHEAERRRFLDQPISTFLADWWELTDESYVTKLSDEKNFELACGSYIVVRKQPPEGSSGEASAGDVGKTCS